MQNTGGTGVDVVLEMAGRSDAIRTGFKILRLGGRMSLLGIPSKPVELNLAEESSSKAPPCRASTDAACTKPGIR